MWMKVCANAMCNPIPRVRPNSTPYLRANLISSITAVIMPPSVIHPPVPAKTLENPTTYVRQTKKGNLSETYRPD